MINIEQLKEISVGDLSAYNGFWECMHNYKNQGAFHLMTDYARRQVAEAIGLDYARIDLIHELWAALKLGLPSSSQIVNIVASATRGDSIEELLSRWTEGGLTKQQIVEAFNVGLDLLLARDKVTNCHMFIDRAIALYVNENIDQSKQYDDELCIAFPGAPNMAPLLAAAVDAADRHLKYGEHYCSAFRLLGEPELLYQYPPNMSEGRKVIVVTPVGTIYLLDRPQRNDTNGSFLKIVKE